MIWLDTRTGNAAERCASRVTRGPAVSCLWQLWFQIWMWRTKLAFVLQEVADHKRSHGSWSTLPEKPKRGDARRKATLSTYACRCSTRCDHEPDRIFARPDPGCSTALGERPRHGSPTRKWTSSSQLGDWPCASRRFGSTSRALVVEDHGEIAGAKLPGRGGVRFTGTCTSSSANCGESLSWQSCTSKIASCGLSCTWKTAGNERCSSTSPASH